MAGCCPPGSLPYLASEYTPIGSKVLLEDAVATEFYHTGDAASKKCLIFVPDIWGWDSGRTRSIADSMSSQSGMQVVVPKLLVPCFEGGSDGDGLPPDFDMATRGHLFGEYIKTITYEDVLKPRFESVIQAMKQKGVEQFYLAGCCWGGWAACKLLADPVAFSSSTFVCGAIFHPSITLEEAKYGGDTLALVSAVSTPLLFMPAGNDPDLYRPGGALLEAIKSKFETSDSIDFPEMKHGWVPRGDITDAATARDCELAINAALAFFAKH